MLANQAAFLAMIRRSEGTDRVADPYRCVYGFGYTIKDLSDHPTATGEWAGERLDSLGPAYAGKISTAAGAYQMILPTWEACKRALKLPNFGAAAQDDAALYLIKQRGALDSIASGDVCTAIERSAGVWASLPGSAAGQPQAVMGALLAAYSEAGGTLA